MAHLDSQVAKRLSPSRSIRGITTEVGVEVGPVLAALACSRMSAVSLTDVRRLRAEVEHSFPLYGDRQAVQRFPLIRERQP